MSAVGAVQEHQVEYSALWAAMESILTKTRPPQIRRAWQVSIQAYCAYKVRRQRAREGIG